MSLIQVQDVTFGYTASKRVLDGVSLSIEPGDSIGLVGESGSGKTTLLRLLLGLTRPSTGSITFNGTPLDPRSPRFMRNYRRQVQVVFQDPYSSLDPRQTVLSIVSEPLRALRIPGDHRQMVSDALASVGLERNILARYPHEFSGGQRQRIAIARAIAVEPEFILLDEPTSALDLSVQAQIIDLLRKLQEERGLSYLFISHDLKVVRALCHRVIVMQHGNIVEQGPVEDVLTRPQTEYTERLVRAAFKVAV